MIGHELKVVALTVLATAVLQIGYLFGVVIRVWGWRLGDRRYRASSYLKIEAGFSL